MMKTRATKIGRIAAIVFFCFIMLGSAGGWASDFKVLTVGTGAPPPEMGRFGPATLVEVGGQRLLFDAGRGVAQRLWQARIPLGSIDYVFITHLHSDHVVGLPDLFLTGLLPGPFGGRKEPFRIMGAGGTKDMMTYLQKAYQADTKIRYNDGEFKSEMAPIEAKDIVEGVVYEKDGVKVTAFDNFHGEAIKPSLGYRVDYQGRSVVISGDTKYCENVIKYARGADLLIHTVGSAKKNLVNDKGPLGKKARVILNHHTPPEDAAKVFNQTKNKMVALTHMVLIGFGKKFPRPSQSEIFEEIRAAGYKGPMVMAKDLMTFEIDDTITVKPFEKKKYKKK